VSEELTDTRMLVAGMILGAGLALFAHRVVDALHSEGEVRTANDHQVTTSATDSGTLWRCRTPVRTATVAGQTLHGCW